MGRRAMASSSDKAAERAQFLYIYGAGSRHGGAWHRGSRAGLVSVLFSSSGVRLASRPQPAAKTCSSPRWSPTSIDRGRMRVERRSALADRSASATAARRTCRASTSQDTHLRARRAEQPYCRNPVGFGVALSLRVAARGLLSGRRGRAVLSDIVRTYPAMWLARSRA